MKPILVHGTLVPPIDDSLSPGAIAMIGNMVLRGLHCPFTWNAVVFDNEETDLMEDRLPLAAGPWDSIIKKCHLAYSEYQRGYPQKSAAYIAECFIPLLEIPGLQAKCELTRLYREALKYVVDATSSFIRSFGCDDFQSQRKLLEFMTSIPSFDSMNHSQRAAVYAIRSKVTVYPQNHMCAKAAIEMNPTETHWNYNLSKILFDADQMGPGMLPAAEKTQLLLSLMKHNKIAFLAPQKTPEPYLHMANLLLTYGHGETCETIYACIKEILAKFSDNAFAYEEAANILQRWPTACTSQKKYCRIVQPLYKNALRLLKKDCLSVRHKLGIHQVLYAARSEGAYIITVREGYANLYIAASLYSAAEIHYRFAVAGNLRFNALGENAPLKIRCHGVNPP